MDRQRRGRPLVVAATALALLWPAGEAHASGTHFLVQLQGGLATPPLEHLDLSLGYGLEAGYGGRLSGTPIRFYAVASFDLATFSGAGSHPQSGVDWESRRSYYDILAGGRMLAPVFRNLRWYLEAMAGTSYQRGRVDRAGSPRLLSTRWDALLAAATGLEYRWHRSFATGLRGEVRWLVGDGEVDPLAATIGDGGSGALRFTVLLSQAVFF